MRIGNGSMATPSRYYTKLTLEQLERLRTEALLLGELYTNDEYQGFTAFLPTWESKGKPEKSDRLRVNGKPVTLIYLDENTLSSKPGIVETWIIRIPL